VYAAGRTGSIPFELGGSTANVDLQLYVWQEGEVIKDILSITRTYLIKVQLNALLNSIKFYYREW